MQVGINATVAGQQVVQTKTITPATEVRLAKTLSIGSTNKAGTLTTRTDDDTGVCTLQTGHGIASSDIVDVYFTGGVRYGMVATVSGNAVTVDGGAGSNLPSSSAAVYVVTTTKIPISIPYANLKALVFNCNGDRSVIRFVESDDTTVLVKVLEETGVAYVYHANSPMVTANPLAADVAWVHLSHNGYVNGTLSAAAVAGGAGYDN